MATTSYITPITDRQQSDIEYARTHQNDLVNKNKGAWNYTDANRVCNNLKYAAEYMYDQGFLSQPYEMSVKTNWVETDIITYEQLNTMIVDNMNNLKTYARSDLDWYPIASIANMDYSIANNLEKNIHQLATQDPIPPDKFRLTINGGTGSGDYELDTVVNIQADAPEVGQVFDYWSGDHLENIGNPRSAITTYRMPSQDITLTANYTGTVPHTLTITTYSGTTTSSLSMGQIVSIEADPAPAGKVFHHWDISPGQYDQNLYEPAASTHFTMPNENVTLTAVYITKGEKQLVVQNGNGSGYYEYDTYAAVSSSKPVNAVFTSWSGDIQYLTGPATQEYNSVRIPDVNRITIKANWYIPPATNIQLTVVNGKIASTGETTGTFTEGDRVTINADTAPEGKTFDIWSKNGGGSFANDRASTTTFTVGATDATITANYRDLEYHTLTVITNSGTTVSTKEKYEYFTVDAKPVPNGYTFDRWTGNINSFNGRYFIETWDVTGTYMGTSDRTITANYRPINTHTLTVKQLSGDVTYTQSEFTTLNITAENAPTGKRFLRWDRSGPGSCSNYNTATTTFTFGNGDTILTPVYVNVWTITVVGGTINGSSSATLDEGGTYTLKSRNLAVYERFDGWTKTGPGSINNTAANETRFTVGNGDTTITANITQYPDKTLTIYWRNPDTNVDTLVSSETYTYGTTITDIEAEVAPDQTTFLTWVGDVNILSPSALASTVTINNLTADTTIIATYYYPEAPEYYTLTVYDGTINGYGTSQSVAAGSQNIIRANEPRQGWEFCEWYGDIQYLVNPDVTLEENSIIMPAKAITLHAKYNMIGELPLYRISVINGTASGSYEDSQHVIHDESGAYIDVPEGTEVTLTADPDTVGWVFDYWDGNFISAGVDDIDVTHNPTIFTSVRANLNVTMVRRELNKYTVYPTNATGPGTVYPGKYPIAGNLIDTNDRHYTFNNWICVDANNLNCISAIESPLLVSTNITLTDKDLWITANYTTHYKLTVVGGQDTGDGYYYNGETVTTVYANAPATGMQFDHWNDPTGIITTNIYDPTPTIEMTDSPATITAVYTSLDASGNSVAVTGSDIHAGLIRRSNTNLINGIMAVGTIVFDRDGCIGVITQTDPDQDDDTDDYSVQKLFYGGNS